MEAKALSIEQNAEHFRALIEGMIAGNEHAFKQLYEKLSGRVFSYIVPRVHDREEALDMLQEIFLGVWSARLRFTYINDASVWGFVFTIARRKLAEHYTQHRKTQAIAELPQDDRYDMDISALGDVHTIERALKQLGDDDRDIVTLRYWSGLSFGEIADMRNKEETAIRVKHHRALEKLKSIIQSYEPQR